MRELFTIKEPIFQRKIIFCRVINLDLEKFNQRICVCLIKEVVYKPPWSCLNQKTFKAFGRINQKILLQKMEALSFCELTLSRFNSDLSERAFIVNIDNKFSNIYFLPRPAKFNTWIMCFLIYINDILQVILTDPLYYMLMILV